MVSSTYKKIIRYSLIIVSGLAVLGALYFGLSYIFYNSLSVISPGYRDMAGNTPAHFTHYPKGFELFEGRPYFLSKYQSVAFPSHTPGIIISGWFIPSAQLGQPIVIVVHGFLSSKADSRVLMMASLLHRHGFNVLAIDLRDNGGSTIEDGRTSLGAKEYNDVLGAKDWAVSQGFVSAKIGVAGGSMGAVSSLIAFQKDPSIAAVFSDSAFATFPMIVGEQLQVRHLPAFFTFGILKMAQWVSGDEMYAVSPLESMTHINGRPIMIVHSKNDMAIPVAHASRLIKVAQDNGQHQLEVWIHTQKGHCDSILSDTATYEAKLIGFFKGAFEVRKD